jgi:tetratricopeptide (TPR) repeat protein
MLEQVLADNISKALHLMDLGRPKDAEQILLGLLKLAPTHRDVLFILGLSSVALNDPQRACHYFQLLLRSYPYDIPALVNQGIVLRGQGRFEDALAAFDKALEINPRVLEAHYNRANMLADLGLLNLAVQGYQDALRLDPLYREAISNLALTFAKLKRFEEAISLFGQHILHDKEGFELWNDLGICYAETRQFDKAYDAFDKAMKQQTSKVIVYNSMGNAYLLQRRFEEAIKCFKRVISQVVLQNDEAKKVSAAAWMNMGTCFVELRDFRQAIESYNNSLKINPGSAETYCSLGAAYNELKQFDKSLEVYELGLNVLPKNPQLLWSRSMLYLALGRFVEGWRDYECRQFGKNPPTSFEQPLWLGDADLSGKSILLHSEQGYGDTIQFCRYAPLVAKVARKVFLRVQKPLATLCKSLEGVDIVLSTDDELPDFDVHCPLMSLPLALGTTPETIPAAVPYLKAGPEAVAQWRKRINQSGGINEYEKLRVGLVWGGGYHSHQSEVLSLNARRNIPLSKMAILNLSGIDFYSLQKGEESEQEFQKLKASGWAGPQLIDHTQLLKTYEDTAALIESLDLIISVCTSVSHLAGSMAKPVWLLNRFDSDWRWFINRTDSPWYPTMRIFNQPAIDDWDSVMDDVRIALIQLVQNRQFVSKQAI